MDYDPLITILIVIILFLWCWKMAKPFKLPNEVADILKDDTPPKEKINKIKDMMKTLAEKWTEVDITMGEMIEPPIISKHATQCGECGQHIDINQKYCERCGIEIKRKHDTDVYLDTSYFKKTPPLGKPGKTGWIQG